MAEIEALAVAMEVVQALAELGVEYLVGGSLASSVHGIPRASQDADLVVDLRPEHVAPLVAKLRAAFYIDDERARDAVRRRTSFNVIHLGTMFKIDLFVLKDEPLAREEMRRRQRLDLPSGTLEIASPEDTILQKLLWYRLGSGVSERHWRDALGILKVKRGTLDLEYLRHWAEQMAIGDLLEEALSESGIAPSAGTTD